MDIRTLEIGDAVAWEGSSKTEFGVVSELGGVKIVEIDGGFAMLLSDFESCASLRKISMVKPHNVR